MVEDHNPYDTGVEATRLEAEELRKQNKRAQYLDDLRVILSTRSGRRLMHAMLAKAAVFGGGFIDNDKAMYYREGARFAGVSLMSDIIEADKPAYIKMLSEEEP